MRAGLGIEGVWSLLARLFFWSGFCMAWGVAGAKIALQFGVFHIDVTLRRHGSRCTYFTPREETREHN